MLFNLKCLSPIITGVVIVILSSCSKDETPRNNQPIPILTDAQKFKLKEVSVQNLPSPYLHFTYDANNFVSAINHESGLYQYRVEYKSGRVSRIINNTFVNKDTLVYHYTGNNVTRIDLLEPGKGKTEEVVLIYDMHNRMIETAWKKVNAATIFKRMLFSYNEQNNMSRCEIYYAMGISGLKKINTYIFEGFDEKINLTSNYLLKESHYLFLPRVRLQCNNPLVLKVEGIDNDFEFVNTYRYDDSLPVLKTTLMKQTRGSGAGVTITGTTRYSYY